MQATRLGEGIRDAEQALWSKVDTPPPKKANAFTSQGPHNGHFGTTPPYPSWPAKGNERGQGTNIDQHWPGTGLAPGRYCWVQHLGPSVKPSAQELFSDSDHVSTQALTIKEWCYYHEWGAKNHEWTLAGNDILAAVLPIHLQHCRK